MYVILLSGPHQRREIAARALLESGFRVSPRTDSANLDDEGLAWIRAYGEDPIEVGAVALVYEFQMRAYQVPIMRLNDSKVGRVESELLSRLEAEFDEGSNNRYLD